VAFDEAAELAAVRRAISSGRGVGRAARSGQLGGSE
jgi:hypothetical protein